ncbi:MAG: hypothetical protein CSA11_01660 [Chloroflexi bacterium]|nr:MAG: hypothetical protein CSA11_01660 [Chloroflexota bacterium]
MQKRHLSILFLILIITACGSNGNGEGEEVSNGAVSQIFIFPGEQEKRLISQETIPQNNCNGKAEISQTIERSHAVLYTLELGSGIKVEADGHALTVAAPPQTHIQHTLQQYEITGLNPTWNWHGDYYGSPAQAEVLVDELVRQQKIPGTCSDGDGCSVVDVLIVDPDGVVS